MINDIMLTMGEHTYVAKMKWINEGRGYYLVTFPSLKGCITMGYSIEEATEMAKDVLAGWLEVTKKLGLPIPKEKNSLKMKRKEFVMPVSVSMG
jgi:predicted RNase H-like HicB family nuclease